MAHEATRAALCIGYWSLVVYPGSKEVVKHSTFLLLGGIAKEALWVTVKI